MRIAIWHNLPTGGAKRAMRDHVRGLVDAGHHVEIWRPPSDEESFLPLADLAPEHVVPVSWPASTGPRGRRGLLATARMRLALLRALDDHWRRCVAEICSGSWDVLYVGVSPHIAVPGIAAYVPCPSVLYLQEPSRALYEARPMLPWAANESYDCGCGKFGRLRGLVVDALRIHALRIQARLEWEYARYYARILANSHYSRECIISVYGVEAHVCYLGVDERRFAPAGRPRERFILGVGRLDPWKRPDLAIRAVGSMPEPRPPLVWVGDKAWQPYVAELHRLAESLDVDFQPRVAVSEDALVQLLNSAACVVYVPRLEPFGLVPLEAAACECPVVGVREAGVRETVIDGVTGLLVGPYPDEIGAAIAAILDDPSMGKGLGSAGRVAVLERWTLRHACERLEANLQAARRSPNKGDKR